MDNEHVPTWLVTLLVVFGCGTAAAFISFLIFHAEVATVREDLAETKERIGELRAEEGDLNDMIPQLEQQLEERRAKVRSLRRQDEDAIAAIEGNLIPAHDEALAAIREQYANRERKLKDTLATAEQARGELIATLEQAVERERDNAEERRSLRAQVEERSRELEQFKRERIEAQLALEQSRDDRLERVQELLDRQNIHTEELVSDGRILQAKADDGFVVIDRGLEDNLRGYTRFLVFNRRGGRNRIKGEIEVIDIDAGISVARVLSEKDPNDPIIPGDHIHNNIYNPNETKIFVVAGVFHTYSQRELKRFIQDAGGKVEPAITQRTHYLVAGEEADEALQRAKLNGITILSEKQVLDLVRRPERFRLRKGMVFVLAGSFNNVDQGAVENFIKGNGGVIEGSVSEDTNVLIAGENAADAISQARLEGALIIHQDQLSHLMAGGQ